jgi:hypothetical protein
MGLPDEDKPTGYRYANGKLKAQHDIISSLATTRGAAWIHDAEQSHAKVSRTTLTADSFSAIESCRSFGTVYAAAKTIYEDTLKGVQKDVAEYQQKLLEVAQHLKERDDRAGEVFAALATTDRSRREDLHADAQNQQANSSQQARDAEVVQDEAAEQASSDGQSQAGGPSQAGGQSQAAGQPGAGADGTPPAGDENSVGGGAPPSPPAGDQTQVRAAR